MPGTCLAFLTKALPVKMAARSAPNATGLGLYLCKRLCDKLDIGLQAQSSPAGTTLSLTFRINDFIHGVQGPL